MRTGRAMSRVAAPGEELVLAAPLRDTAVTAAVLALTAVTFAVVADHGILAHIQHADDAWLRLMVSGRAAGPGRARVAWGAAATGFSVLMASDSQCAPR